VKRRGVEGELSSKSSKETLRHRYEWGSRSLIVSGDETCRETLKQEEFVRFSLMYSFSM
jgi:hypothetical protein